MGHFHACTSPKNGSISYLDLFVDETFCIILLRMWGLCIRRSGCQALIAPWGPLPRGRSTATGCPPQALFGEVTHLAGASEVTLIRSWPCQHHQHSHHEGRAEEAASERSQKVEESKLGTEPFVQAATDTVRGASLPDWASSAEAFQQLLHEARNTERRRGGPSGPRRAREPNEGWEWPCA